jgi:hypothetical protein
MFVFILSRGSSRSLPLASPFLFLLLVLLLVAVVPLLCPLLLELLSGCSSFLSLLFLPAAAAAAAGALLRLPARDAPRLYKHTHTQRTHTPLTLRPYD